MLQSKTRILFHCGDLGGVETTDFDSGFFGSLSLRFDIGKVVR